MREVSESSPAPSPPPSPPPTPEFQKRLTREKPQSQLYAEQLSGEGYPQEDLQHMAYAEHSMPQNSMPGVPVEQAGVPQRVHLPGTNKKITEMLQIHEDMEEEDTIKNITQLDFWIDNGLMGLLTNRHEYDTTGLVARHGSLLYKLRSVYDPVGAAAIHWCILQSAVLERTDVPFAAIRYFVETVKTDGKGVLQCNLQYLDPDQSDDIPGRYDGESCLHLAIATNNIRIVALLLEHGADIYSRVTGRFFLPGVGFTRNDKSEGYFGDFPFTFAVGLGLIPVAQMLLDNAVIPADGDDATWRTLPRHLLQVNTTAGQRGSQVAKRLLLRSQDTYGNTPLHIAILHRRMGMFDWLIDQHQQSVEGTNDAAVPDKERQTVLHVKGAQGYTALGLAAVLGHRATFDHVFDCHLSVVWRFGATACCRCPLDQIDTIPLSEHVVIGASHSAFRLVFLWSISELVDHWIFLRLLDLKWRAMRWLFFTRITFHIFFLAILAVLCTEFVSYNKVKVHTASENDTLMALEITGLVCVTIFIMFNGFDGLAARKHLRRANTAGAGREFVETHCFQPERRGVFSTVPMSHYDLLSWAGSFCYLLQFFMYLHEDFDHASHTTRGTLAFTAICYFLTTLQSLMVASEGLGKLVTILLLCVSQDMWRFCIVYVFCLIGFGLAGFLLFTETDDVDGNSTMVPDETSWASFGFGLHVLLQRTLGATGSRGLWTDWGAGYGTSHDHFLNFKYVFMLVWTVFSLVVMLNMLIAMFADTYSSVSETARARWICSRGRMILLMERRLRLCGRVEWIERKLRVNYAPPVFQRRAVENWSDACSQERGHFIVIEREVQEALDTAVTADPGTATDERAATAISVHGTMTGGIIPVRTLSSRMLNAAAGVGAGAGAGAGAGTGAGELAPEVDLSPPLRDSGQSPRPQQGRRVSVAEMGDNGAAPGRRKGPRRKGEKELLGGRIRGLEQRIDGLLLGAAAHGLADAAPSPPQTAGDGRAPSQRGRGAGGTVTPPPLPAEERSSRPPGAPGGALLS